MKFAKTLVAATLVATAGLAQAEVTANISAVSNYMFRGVTLSTDDAAVQGGLDYSNETGFYAGTWLSSLGQTTPTTTEMDLYFGFGNEMGAVSYDVGALMYYYPSSGTDADYTEVYLNLGFGPATAGVAYTAWAETSNNGPLVEGDVYYSLSMDVPVDLDGLAPSVWVGYYDFADDGKTTVGNVSYTHWGASLTKDAGEFGAVTLSYDQTDGGGNNQYAVQDTAKFTIGWSKEF